MIEIINGDLLESKEKYICHQANCISNSAAGLAKFLFKKYPYSDVYSNRSVPDQVGTINIKGNGNEQRYVINMFAQYYPGPPKYKDSLKDGIVAREKFFSECLTQIFYVPNLESIAFPFGIGCGLAGGNWDNYLKMLESFEKSAYSNYKTIVKIYKNS